MDERNLLRMLAVALGALVFIVLGLFEWWSPASGGSVGMVGSVGAMLLLSAGFALAAREVIGRGVAALAAEQHRQLDDAEQALVASETRLRLAMHATGLGLWDYRPGHESVGSNDEVALLLGYEPAGFCETRSAFVERLHPDDRHAVRARFRAYLDGAQQDYLSEFRMRTRSGEYRWFRSVGQVVERDARGGPARVVGTYLDITAQVEAMRRLSELSARLLAVQEQERSRLARELHDEIGQQLTAIRFNLHAIGAARDAEAQSLRLADCVAILDQTLDRVRARVLDLRPPMLDDMGLGAALDWYCRRQEERAGVCILLEGAESLGRLDEPVEITAFRVVQEAVSNALQHGGADQVTVGLRVDNGAFHIEVSDTGRGFDVNRATTRAAREGYGLIAMRERVALLGGAFALSSEPGTGVRIAVRLPLAVKSRAGGEDVQS
ncbi:sensor histidine kinase [Rhodocyclaceae bacterium SMB388]